MKNICIDNKNCQKILDFKPIKTSRDKLFNVGDNAKKILVSKDGKEELIFINDERILVAVLNELCPPTYYELLPTKIELPIKAVLMDLDGTSIISEEFWMELIRLTVCKSLKDENFNFSDEDIPFVSGHSVSEHLCYCINKYNLSNELSELTKYYYMVFDEFIRNQNNNIGKLFKPRDDLKEFLLSLKKNGIKIGLVTSGTIEKAKFEIELAFKLLDFDVSPDSFYDCIITAGNSLSRNAFGTLGELTAKPHPWLYRECALIGLDIDFESRNHVVCIEDSAAGVMSSRLAGFPSIGITGGNIKRSECESLCQYFIEKLDELIRIFQI